MRVVLYSPEPARDPHKVEFHEQKLAMLLRPGSIEVGLHRSDMTKFTYDAGELILSRRHVEEWVRTADAYVLTLGISDAALRTACDGRSGEVELRSTARLVDTRVSALVAAVNAERLAGFPSGRLFLDCLEQALAVALVARHAANGGPGRMYRGGLTSARLRKVVELVDAKIEDELTLDEMAESVRLSTAHFSRAFRKSTGESPHQFVLRHRVERAKEMLRAPEARVLDIALACGFKTQQHFARIFRRICGVSPTEYRHGHLC
jgi:AraC family transcriptional regulator